MDFLGLERPVEYTGYSIFDPTTAKMVLDAQDKYFAAVYADYQQGLEDMKEFRKEYDDFITPILADQEWYNNNVTGKVRGFINDAYARGIDLTRSQEGRAALSQIINSVDVGKIAKLRSSKQAAEDYIKARGVLQSKGLYSPEMESFITNGRSLENWNTLNDGVWNRTSPMEAASLLDLTYNSYKNRTPRDLTAEDLEAAGIPYDKRYQYTGYLDSDLMKVAPGAAMAIAADPRAAYYRHLAEQKVAARGGNYTQADVDAQFYRDIADANKWALVDPTKKADEFAKSDYEFKHALALQDDAQAFQREMAEQAAKDKLDQIRARYGFKDKNGKQIDNNYSLTEELHHDLLYQGLLNSGMPIPLTEIDKNGNRVVKYDKNGKMLTKDIRTATFDELEFAANYQNRYGVMQQEYASRLTSGDKYNANKSWNKFKQRYGSRITNIQLAAMLKKQPQSDGGFLLSVDQAKLLRGVKGMMADIRGSKIDITHNDRISEILPSDVVTALNGENTPVQIKFVLNDSGNNATQVFEKYNRGRTDIYVTGTVTYNWEEGSGVDKKKHVKTIENVQLPLGLNSEINAKNTINTSLAGANRSAYGSIDANYLKQLGQQQKVNLGLFANTPEMSSMIDPSTMTLEEWNEFLQNNQ